ncbi:glycine receptor subunit alpha-4-like isoform X2 [Bradysia coprophila]|uniref:glycine receptor subunit alpha-4-like isoform X2 n=1 Tax=Bradysia coprophila TaxID=38358 RepID=UPI00187D738C|nr:glycine receptor subunit alpha-4-like isoform X2 [Bradysia coprophila]
MRLVQIICALILLKIKMVSVSTQAVIASTYTMDEGYDKNERPSALTDVSIGLYLNRISAVNENNEEISIDVFLQVIWEDKRIKHKNDPNTTIPSYIELKTEERHEIWVPDLYIRQLREMKVLKLFEEISSLRLYRNSTVVFSMGATIIIKCDMDFLLYPLDVQICPVDFSSYKYSVKDMTFRWKKENPITFPKDFDEGFFRLPKYVVSFSTEQDPHIVYYGDVDHCSARLEITLSRELKSYLLEHYLPSTLFVSMSWGSFVVIPEVVPGRMVLLVTTLLTLVTMFNTVRNNSPDSLELKCIEVWLISCILFVFLALIEYFIVLFGIRYDKHWRTAKTITKAMAMSNSETQMPNSMQRKNGLEQSARAFQNLNKITPENKKKITNIPSNAPPIANSTANIHPIENNTGSISSNPNTINRKRFRNAAEVAILYAGSQRGKLDQISLIIFPLSFLVFSMVYWILYITESKKRM